MAFIRTIILFVLAWTTFISCMRNNEKAGPSKDLLELTISEEEKSLSNGQEMFICTIYIALYI